MRAHRSTPRGFTLVELLVVMSLMAVLAGMTIAFLPNATSSAREARAASLLQSWLNVAKQRALRDRAPRGVRLHYGDVTVGANNVVPYAVINGQYLEQPDDFTGGTVHSPPNLPISSVTWVSASPTTTTVTVTTTVPHSFYVGEGVSISGGVWSNANVSATPAGSPSEFNGAQTITAVPNFTTFTFTDNSHAPVFDPTLTTPSANGVVRPLQRVEFSSGIDLMNGYPPAIAGDPSPAETVYWSVQPGDYIEIFGTGLMSRITHVDYAPGMPLQIKITPALRFPISTPTPNYRILRAPRAVGDETLKLPDETLIDLGTNATFGNLLPLAPGPVAGTGYVDILFSPSGSVISRGIASSTINLWVRSPSPNAPTDLYKGDPSIVSVFVRTGFVGAFNPDRTSAYALVK